MTYVLDNLSPTVLAEAIEQNGVHCCLAWTGWPKLEIGKNDQMAWTLSDIPFPFFNNVFNARLTASDIDKAVDDVVNKFRERNVPAFWWTGPTTKPHDLGRYLLAKGFQHAFEAPAMAVDLHAIADSLPVPSAFAVDEVTDESLLREWCSVMTPVYEFPDFAAKAWFKMLRSLGLAPHKPLRHFLGRLDGTPVATASLYIGSGVAGISSVATVPEFRRQGIATAITTIALREARRAGYHIGTLFSSPEGEGVYKKIGFKEYARGNCYLWPNE